MARQSLIINIILAIFLISNSAYSQAPVPTPIPYATTISINSIRTFDTKRPIVNEADIISPIRTLQDEDQTTQYFDGLGRLLQTVTKQASPLGNDIVTPKIYDGYSRESFKFLPFASYVAQAGDVTNDGNFKIDPFQQLTVFYSDSDPNSPIKSQGETFYFSQMNLEPSPLNRVLESFAPGNSWAGTAWNGTTPNTNLSTHKSVQQQYLVNTTADNVQIWTIAAAQGSIPVSSGPYSAGTLYKNITQDEAGNQVVEYKDIEGKIILKKVQIAATPGVDHTGWLCTYYVYDDLNNLRFVISPQAVQLLMNNSTWNLSSLSNLTNELCYRYEYDQRNRMIIKKIPGAGEMWMVYDARDRLVLSQNAILRISNQWLFTKYDALDRIVMTGTYTDNSNITQSTMQSYVTAQNMGFFETFVAGSFPQYTLTNSFPSTVASNILTCAYFDNYNWVASSGTSLTSNIDVTGSGNFLSSSNSTFPYAQPVTVKSVLTRSSPTGSAVIVLGTSSQYLYQVKFYDDHNRELQTQDINVTGGKDISTVQYDWIGKTLMELLQHQKNGSNPQSYSVLTAKTYDAVGRLLTISKTITGTASAPQQTIATYAYDELGQLKSKSLGNSIDNMVYDHNIRGWLLGINRNFLAGTSTNYFGMELGYDKQSSMTGTTTFAATQFNGNITGTIWKSAGDGVGRKYDLTYDNANRLAGATFYQNTSSNVWDNGYINYSVSNLGYDANGNIISMNQQGFKVGGSLLIDQLAYTYQTNSNKLSQVTDGYNDPSSKLGDFHYNTATKGSSDYSYDGNGNLVLDNNKGITSITYNYLNLPQQITVASKGTITYTYDASGNKLYKSTVDNTITPTKTALTTYIGGFVYQANSPAAGGPIAADTLQFIAQEEGRIRWAYHKYTNGYSAYSFEYDFFEKDHLGNTRMVLTQQKDTASYLASGELAYRTTETQLFSNITTTVIPRTTAPGYPTDLTITNPNDYVFKVNGNPGGNKLGPALLLKVMSGDKIDIAVQSFYNSGTTSTANTSLTDVLTSLATGVVNMTSGGKGSITDLNNQTTSPIYAAVNSFLTNDDQPQTTKPKAYLNWILLDDQLKYVSSYPQSGAVVVGAAGALNMLGYTGLPITKNGFLYIWVSNETPNWDVFFDNLVVKQYAGPLLEESHYYPFGLTMAAISSKALKPFYAENKFKFNGGNELQNKEFSDGSGLELYDAVHRMYDPQIGRFGQIDPYAEVFSGWSPYSFSNNDPTLLNDPDGLLSDSSHPQELAQVDITPRKKSSTNLVDSRPSKENPDFKFGTNTPFYIHYDQTAPGQWNPQITREFATSLKISAMLIPAGRALKSAYEAYKILQRLRSLKNIPESAEKAAEAARNGVVKRPGYADSKPFQNDGRSGSQILPKTDENGNPISYTEYDVNPKVPGQGRGTERVVYGSDDKAYYTDDHYKSFQEIK